MASELMSVFSEKVGEVIEKSRMAGILNGNLDSTLVNQKIEFN